MVYANSAGNLLNELVNGCKLNNQHFLFNSIDNFTFKMLNSWKLPIYFTKRVHRLRILTIYSLMHVL